MKNAASMVEPENQCSSGEPLESEPDPFQHSRLNRNNPPSKPAGVCQLMTLR